MTKREFLPLPSPTVNVPIAKRTGVVHMAYSLSTNYAKTYCWRILGYNQTAGKLIPYGQWGVVDEPVTCPKCLARPLIPAGQDATWKTP